MLTGLDASQATNFGVILFFATSKRYLVHVIVGCTMGYFLGLISGASVNERKLMTICIGFGDVTDIPLTLTSVLGTSSIFAHEKNFSSNAKTYTLLYNVFIIVYKWSVAYA
jgi:hydrogenase/urease accessory protein HupE